MCFVLTALTLHSRSVCTLAAVRARFGLNCFYTRRLVGCFVASRVGPIGAIQSDASPAFFVSSLFKRHERTACVTVLRYLPPCTATWVPTFSSNYQVQFRDDLRDARALLFLRKVLIHRCAGRLCVVRARRYACSHRPLAKLHFPAIRGGALFAFGRSHRSLYLDRFQQRFLAT